MIVHREAAQMAIEIFNRYENKYRLDGKTFRRVRSEIAKNTEPDKFNRSGEAYTIRNICYDTSDSALIRRSLAKPRYREKLRLRAYGEVGGDSEVYVEIKKKFNGIVNKRRSTLILSEAYDFLRSGELPESQPYMNMQVLREAQYILQREDLKPAVYLAYDRCAYFGSDLHNLRISFDTNIRTRRTDLDFESGDYGEPLLDPDVWLMEIKVAQSIPVWLCRLLSENGIYPVSFSKYGAEYTRTISREEFICSIQYFPRQTALQSAWGV
jgi:SPX domain protein involved in polyphosphate accumulation